MKAALKKLIAGASATAAPRIVSPMLCTLTKEVTTSSDYIHENKFDGYRIMLHINKRKVRLDSRSGLNYTSKYPAIAAAAHKLGHDTVIDGELCALNKKGRPDFDALQKAAAATELVYYAFDILWLDGYNLMPLPLLQRKAILLEVIRNRSPILYSEHFTNGAALYKKIQRMGLEGIVSKKADSPYLPGDRGTNWYKTPTRVRQEFVIGGWAESDRGRSFKSLLFGAYKNGQLEWIGRSGGGYKDKEMPVILKKLKSLETKNSPFVNNVLDSRGAVTHWVKPQLVANFEFAAWTRSGRIRKPATFLGFRSDKKAKDVVREVPYSGRRTT